MNPALKDISGNGWSMRPTRPDDGPAIAALLNTVFGDWGDAATWSWKYHDPPAPFRLISAVAEAEGRLVGHYGIVPVNVIHRGGLIRGAQAVDAAVLPEFRRRGILSALAGLVLDSAAGALVSFIYAFPGLYSLNLNRQIGFQPVMIVPEMLRLLGPKKFIYERLRSFPGDLRAIWRWRDQQDWSPGVITRLAHFRSSLSWLAGWMSDPVWHQNIPESDITVRNLAGFDESFDPFWRSFQADTPLGLVKDCAYLSWRYGRHPDREYRIWGAYESGNLVGYLVLHIADFNSSICELEILPGKDQAIFGLVRHAAQAAQEAGSLALVTWASNRNPLRAALQTAGFISQQRLHQWAAASNQRSARFYQIILHTGHLSGQSQEQFFEVMDDWSLAMGDSDLV